MKLRTELESLVESLEKGPFGERMLLFRQQSRKRGTKKVRGWMGKLIVQMERADERVRAWGEVPFWEKIAESVRNSIDEQTLMP